jgi:predicted transcriptional regulator
MWEIVMLKFDYLEFAVALECVIQDSGLTAREISALSGVPETTLCRVRRCENKPDANNLVLLAAWAGLNPAEYVIDDPVEKR